MGPMNAGLPAPAPGMRWKSKLITASGVFDPFVEAPGVEFFYPMYGGGGGAGQNSGPNGGGQGYIAFSPFPVKLTAVAAITIGAGGASNGAGGGNTSIVATNADGSSVNLVAQGAGTNGTTAGGLSRGQQGILNGFVSYSTSVTGGEGSITAYFVGPICLWPAGGTAAYHGAGGYKGAGGIGNTQPGQAGTGYSSGGGAGQSGGWSGAAGQPGFVEFFWQEPIQ